MSGRKTNDNWKFQLEKVRGRLNLGQEAGRETAEGSGSEVIAQNQTLPTGSGESQVVVEGEVERQSHSQTFETSIPTLNGPGFENVPRRDNTPGTESKSSVSEIDVSKGEGGNMSNEYKAKQTSEDTQPPLSPEEKEELRRKIALAAKFNKAFTVAALGMAGVTVIAVGVSVIRGLWGKEHSSLMRI